ncbi:MAG TPA: hypothetical protein VNV38_12760 [Stellaceae bacterium]|jgi:hypothetical protein|nr:hypothetical protein [Stellaceae bacterium]
MPVAAIAVAVIGFVLKAAAALGSGWFLVPLAAIACVCHVVVHVKAAGAAEPPTRLAMLSNVFLAAALLLQLEYSPGYNCAEDTLSSVSWKLGLASEEGCILMAGPAAVIFDVLLYLPVIITWVRMGARAAVRRV